MSLDDAINAAQRQADQQADDARWAQEKQQREQAEAHALAVEAVTRLRPLGTATFVRVEPTKRFGQLGECYTGTDGQRYRPVSQQRCWVLIRMEGIRTEHDPDGPWQVSPVLLLEDGTIGRFWPDPAVHGCRPDEYVTTSDLDPVKKTELHWGHEKYLDGLKRNLGETIVRYQRTAE